MKLQELECCRECDYYGTNDCNGSCECSVWAEKLQERAEALMELKMEEKYLRR